MPTLIPNKSVLLIALLLWYGAGFLGAQYTTETVQSEWYQAIKPILTPPSSVFPIVWSILYALIAISFWFAWNPASSSQRAKLLTWFGINLIANATWTFFYFSLRSPLAGLIDIILIDISGLMMIHYTSQLSKPAQYLLYPYAVWLAFATLLNVLSL
ncbi:tryptophan-rich sensory protein [Candidatus Pacearchaeota archaeon]|nr:tryptophan-rich sensory protein [Candidatus Pacearchaeota archaeon]